MEKNGKPGAETTGGCQRGECRAMHWPTGLSLSWVGALDVALHVAVGHAPGGAIGASDSETVARSPALWLPAGACHVAPPRAALCFADGATRAAAGGPADRGPGGAPEDSASPGCENQIR